MVPHSHRNKAAMIQYRVVVLVEVMSLLLYMYAHMQSLGGATSSSTASTGQGNVSDEGNGRSNILCTSTSIFLKGCPNSGINCRDIPL